MALNPRCQLKKIVQDSRALRFSISFSNAEIKAATIDAMQLDRWVMQGKNVLISMPHIDFFIESSHFYRFS